MKIFELLSEKTLKAPTRSQCQKPNLSNVRMAQCVSRGFKAHDSDHTDGSGRQGVKGSGKKLRGRKVRGEKFGGPLKYYPGSRD